MFLFYWKNSSNENIADTTRFVLLEIIGSPEKNRLNSETELRL